MIVLQKEYIHTKEYIPTHNKNIIIAFQKILEKQSYLDSLHFIWMIRKLQKRNIIPWKEHVLFDVCGNKTQRSS